MAPKKRNGNGKVHQRDEPKLPVPVAKPPPPPHDEPEEPARQHHAADEIPKRRGTVQRRTRETDVTVALDLDGTGRAEAQTGLRFFDHMLETLAKHSLIDLRVVARGDVDVDPHHTVEDVGLCIGRAILEAIGDRTGMVRYGAATVPFDEALIRCAVDLGGRPAFVWRVAIPPGRIGAAFDVELAEVFFNAVTNEGRMNLHLILEYGTNRHHIVEGCFKAFARALERAVILDPRRADVASTKGRLD